MCLISAKTWRCAVSVTIFIRATREDKDANFSTPNGMLNVVNQ
jgi:hypothetical protein